MNCPVRDDRYFFYLTNLDYLKDSLNLSSPLLDTLSVDKRHVLPGEIVAVELVIAIAKHWTPFVCSLGVSEFAAQRTFRPYI